MGRVGKLGLREEFFWKRCLIDIRLLIRLYNHFSSCSLVV